MARLLRRKGCNGGFEEDEAGEVEREGAWREGTRYIAGGPLGARSHTSDDTVLLGTPSLFLSSIRCIIFLEKSIFSNSSSTWRIPLPLLDG
jgi:hypothetical protein